jgi:putative flippase GtrA
MNSTNTTRTTLVRWLKFNMVGGIGVVLQLALLAVFSEALHLSYLTATAVAVEMTVLHNFAWHERYTWKDRAPAPGALAVDTYLTASTHGSLPSLLSRLIRFHLGNGAVSLVGNLVLMNLFAGKLYIPVLVANAVAITICSLVNFCLADRWVFARGASHWIGPLKSQAE